MKAHNRQWRNASLAFARAVVCVSVLCSSALMKFWFPFSAWLQQYLSANESILTLCFLLEKFSTSKQTRCVGKGVMRSEFSQLILAVSRKCLNFGTVLIQICISFWMGLTKPALKSPGQIVTHWKKKKRSSYFFPFSFPKHANPILLTISLKHIFSLPIYYSLPE